MPSGRWTVMRIAAQSTPALARPCATHGPCRSTRETTTIGSIAMPTIAGLVTAAAPEVHRARQRQAFCQLVNALWGARGPRYPAGDAARWIGAPACRCVRHGDPRDA